MTQYNLSFNEDEIMSDNERIDAICKSNATKITT